MARRVLVRPRAATRRRDDPAFELDPGAARTDLSVRSAWGAILVADRPASTAAGAGRGRTVEVVIGGWRFELEVEDAAQHVLRQRARRGDEERGSDGPVEVRAIIPGRVVSVDVAIGDNVPAGGHLLVLEAMKMQNELRAPASGVVARIAVSAGQTVDRGDVLVVLDPLATGRPHDPELSTE